MIVLSQFLEDRFGVELVGDRAEGVGYLLKHRVADGPSSSTQCGAWLRARPCWTLRSSPGWSADVADGPLDDLTPQDREVLALMAEGRSNTGIADALVHGPHRGTAREGIFVKLGLPAGGRKSPPGASPSFNIYAANA